jgi:hypothetical protein
MRCAVAYGVKLISREEPIVPGSEQKPISVLVSEKEIKSIEAVNTGGPIFDDLKMGDATV